MGMATVRIPEEKRDLLQVIAETEKTEMQQILSDLIDEYVERHRETLDLLSRPAWVGPIQRGKREVAAGTPGKDLDELAD